MSNQDFNEIVEFIVKGFSDFNKKINLIGKIILSPFILFGIIFAAAIIGAAGIMTLITKDE